MKKLFAEIRRHNGKGGWYRIVTGGARLAGCWLAAGWLLVGCRAECCRFLVTGPFGPTGSPPLIEDTVSTARRSL